MITFRNATCNTFRNKSQSVDANYVILRDLRLFTFHLIHARSNVKCAMLNVYAVRVPYKFAFVKSLATFPSEQIYLSRAKDTLLDLQVSLKD